MNTFIKEPSDALLTELMRAVLGKFNNDVPIIKLDGANTSFDILTKVSNAFIKNDTLAVPDEIAKDAFVCLTCLYALLKIAGRGSQFECVKQGKLVDKNNNTIEHSSDTAATNWCKSTMQLISDSLKGKELGLHKTYDLLT